jgi:hypothetical protein
VYQRIFWLVLEANTRDCTVLGDILGPGVGVDMSKMLKKEISLSRG